MAMLFNLDQLVDMMSIGTLLAYTIVAICVLVLRYQDEEMTKLVSVKAPNVFRQFFNGNSFREPNSMTSSITKVGIVVFAIFCLVWCSLQKVFDLDSTGGIVALSLVGAVLILICVVIGMQPVSTIELTFKVPLVPFVPCLSVFANLYLMFQLDLNTWIRFLIWIVIGYVIYFCYGMRNSTQISRSRSHAEVAASALQNQGQHVNSGFEPDYKVENGGRLPPPYEFSEKL